ncbi:hypothetical protein [Nocardia yamanashiensis]|uniref:hypothetical protein n=1 Tax=Nocardia yamanashiensis TaxID=209247 RepID=UPI00082AC3D3|nr:hypothetical protein [Nocardia yamanashiensis]
MRSKGISYDTGFVRAGGTSRERFDPGEVARELRIIRDDLHCTAVRVMGGDAGRIECAARLAADLGLEVWVSPYPLEQDADAMLALLIDCAERAERIRVSGADVVFVTGAELSLMAPGFLPGDSVGERVRGLLGGDDRAERIADLGTRINEFLTEAVTQVRKRFGGKVTYASVPLECVDWTLFDIMSVDLYRSAEIAGQFAAGVKALVAQGMPVAVTEFGCATFQGATDRGAHGLDIVEYDERGPVRLDGQYLRDEPAQAACLRELLTAFDEGGIDTTFVFTFALYDHVHRADPLTDLDLASYGIVRTFDDRHGTTYPDLPWEPKQAFTAVADFYRSH